MTTKENINKNILELYTRENPLWKMLKEKEMKDRAENNGMVDELNNLLDDINMASTEEPVVLAKIATDGKVTVVNDSFNKLVEHAAQTLLLYAAAVHRINKKKEE
jgi:hypothetical protein